MNEMDRRRFLSLVAQTCIGGSTLGAVLAGKNALGDEPPPYPGGFTREATPGFAAEPETDKQRTVAAIVDTVVPGPESDPAGGPGALEAGALNLIYDRFYPAWDYLDSVVVLVDHTARQEFSATFEELELEQREQVLLEAQELLPFLRHLYRFIRGVFFADLHSGTGSDYLGFPGPNLGYIEHPDFSFRRPMSEELSDDGNLP